jgi:hypothetical protein
MNVSYLPLPIQIEEKRASEEISLHIFVQEWTDCLSGDFSFATS